MRLCRVDLLKPAAALRWTALVLLAISALLTMPPPGHAQTPTNLPAAAGAVDQSVNEAAREAAGTSPASVPKPVGRVGLSLPSGATLGVVPVRGLIRDFTLTSMQRRVDRALADGASVIVFEIDTNGGVLTSALDISKYIKGLNLPTIAWVHPKAISAGALIAAACDTIAMSPGASMGDCAPINPLSANLGATERAKALAPLLAEFRDSATRAGKPYAAYQAMCVLNNEVYLVEHRESGERRLVNQVDYRVLVDGDAPDEADRVDLSTLDYTDDAQLARVGRPSLQVGVAEERGQWRPVTKLNGSPLPLGRVHDGSSPWTLTASEAEALGLSWFTTPDRSALATRLGAGGVLIEDETWSYAVASVLTHPFARWLLIVLMLVGVTIEAQFPGLVVPGLVALAALLALLISPFVIGLAEVWHMLLVVARLALIVVEVLLTPTFGLLGIVGLVGVIVGLVLSVVPGSGGGGAFQSPAVWNEFLQSLAAVLLGLVATAAALWAGLFGLGRVAPLSGLVLSAAQHRVLGGGDGAGHEAMPGRSDTRRVRGEAEVNQGQADDDGGSTPTDRGLGVGMSVGEGSGVDVGEFGVTLNALHPIGEVTFHDGRLPVQAQSYGEWIDAGTRVRVVGIEGMRVVVESVVESAGDSESGVG